MKQSGTERHIDANVAIASLQNVIVIVFKGPARVADIERMRDLEIQLARDYLRGPGVVQVSMRESSGGRDTQDIRRAFTTMMRDVAPMVRAGVGLFSGLERVRFGPSSRAAVVLMQEAPRDAHHCCQNA